MKKLICVLLVLVSIYRSDTFAQDNPKAILEKSFQACMNLQGGTYKMDVSKKTFNDAKTKNTFSQSKFSAAEGDSAFPFKFIVMMNNGDGNLCTSNDLVQLNGSDSTGVIYSRSSNQSMFRGAYQSEGLFPPFFQTEVVFSLDRLQQTTFIVRQGKDEEAMGKSCFNIKFIDLIRATLPDGQRQEKTFLIDKQTYLPVAYSERSVMKLNNDSVYKENNFKLKEFSSTQPHDSLFTFKNIPAHFRLRNILEKVYHHHLKAGNTAPDFKGKVLMGDSITLKSFAGKKVVLFFFYRSSYPCLKALNAMQQFQNENKDMEVLLIGIDASERDLSTLLSKRNISLKAIEDGQPIADKYYISAVPSFVSIDEKGIVKKIENGFGAETDLRY
ncbi:MAG: TlpA disulfide reductase family protein [Bacteroidota bacterium]